MPRLLTQAQYARKSKYSRARITQLVKQGVIILKKEKVDPTQADAAIEANIDRSRREKAERKAQAAKTPQMEFTGNGFNTDHSAGHNGDSQNGFNTEPSLTEARRLHELKKMEKTELEIKARRGQLVSKNEATKWVIALGAAAKLAFLNLPRRLAGILKTMTDEKEIELLLLTEIRTIIHELEAPVAKHKRIRRKNSQRSLAKHLATAR